MTCIVEGFTHKKQLKLQLDRANAGFQDGHVAIAEPFPGGTHWHTTSNMVEGDSFIVTNHPKRSWFATITKKQGKLVVK